MCSNNITCLKQISTFLQVPVPKIGVDHEKMATCSLNNITTTGFVNIILKLLQVSKSNVSGTTAIEVADIRQWLEYCATYASQYTNATNAYLILQELNHVLSVKTFFVGNSMTIADVALYYVLENLMRTLTHLDKEKYLNVSRWYDHLQQDYQIRNNKAFIDFNTIFLSCVSLK